MELMRDQTQNRTNWSMIVSRDPRVRGGVAVFRGTRVPLTTLTGIIKAGGTIEEFLEGFPGVERWQVERFLELSAEAAERFS